MCHKMNGSRISQIFYYMYCVTIPIQLFHKWIPFVQSHTTQFYLQFIFSELINASRYVEQLNREVISTNKQTISQKYYQGIKKLFVTGI